MLRIIQTAPPPPDLLVTMREVQASLSSLKTGKAIGPDMIPNRVLKEFSPELASVIMDIYNRSLVEGYVPGLLKSSIANPLPKVSPPQEIKSDLRSIALTCTIPSEGFTRSRLIKQIAGKINPRQYARERHYIADALIYFLQAFHEATDTGERVTKIFFAGFSKGFDHIDHNILLKELSSFNVDPVLPGYLDLGIPGR